MGFYNDKNVEKVMLAAQDEIDADLMSFDDRKRLSERIEKNYDIFNLLANIKDTKGKNFFSAHDLCDIFNEKEPCQYIEKHPQQILEIFNNPQKLKKLFKYTTSPTGSFYDNRANGFYALMAEEIKGIKANNEIRLQREFENLPKKEFDSLDKLEKEAELEDLRKMTKDIQEGMDKSTPIRTPEEKRRLRENNIRRLRKMTKGIQEGMDKSTPIKEVDTDAPFNVVATKILEKKGR